MRPLINHLRRHAVGYVALFVALGGTGYAAMSLPRASVGARQIKNHSITSLKFNQRSIGGTVRAWAVVSSDGIILRGAGQPREGRMAAPGAYQISWGVRLKQTCATVATIDFAHSPPTETISTPTSPTVKVTAGYPVAFSGGVGPGRRKNFTQVQTYDQDGHLTPLGFDVTVTC